LTHNIKLNLILASRTDSFQQGSRLLRRGEQTVPKRYIKSAHWLKVGDDEGYFAVHKGAYFPIEFNYKHCYWYCVKYSNIRSTWETLRVAPSEYFLDIQDDEVVPRSDWGLLDADDPETDNEEGPSYHFSEPTSESQLGGPEDIDVQIPEGKDKQYEAQLQALAAAILVLTNDETKSYPTFSTIMATQTQTRSVAATGNEAITMPSNDLALQAESLPTETPFEVSPLQEKRPIEEEVEVGEMAEETMKEIPTILIIAEEDTLEAMASSVARNPPSSRAIERTLSLSYLSGRSTRC
jgi:hypothetical protein